MAAVRRDFDKEAATWDANPTRTRLADDLFRTLTAVVTLDSSMDVLDFGCGTGLFALKAAPLVRSVTGADTSTGMLEVLDIKAGSPT